MRTRDHALYPCPTMKDSKWAFKPVPCRNTTAALCNLCLTITAMSRTLGQLEGVFRQGAQACFVTRPLIADYPIVERTRRCVIYSYLSKAISICCCRRATRSLLEVAVAESYALRALSSGRADRSLSKFVLLHWSVKCADERLRVRRLQWLLKFQSYVRFKAHVALKALFIRHNHYAPHGG